MRHFLNQGHSVLARTASLTIPPQSHKLHDFIHVHDKKEDYTQKMHNSRQNFHRRAHGLAPGGPWLETFALGGALSSLWHSKRLVLIEINNKNKQNRTLKNDLIKSLKGG